jgi:SpoIID/LytB domain protein
MKRLFRLLALGCALAVFGAVVPVALARTVVLVRGFGWGNGVGMSQWGAEGYAAHGAGYRAILAHYYPHTTIATVTDREVRVLLEQSAGRIRIRSRAPFLIVDARGRKLHRLAGSITFDSRLEVDGERLAAPVRIDPGAQPLSLDGRGYRGTLTVGRDRKALTVVDTLPLELYLRGVVPAELPKGWMPQAYAAQAVAARSYALATMEPGRAFDLYADNRSQMYGGIAAETPATNAAVADTAGQALSYDGQIIVAYYDSNAGGRTSPVQDVFPGLSPQPYLVSVSDPYGASAPNGHWVVSLSDEKLSDRFGLPVDDIRASHVGPGIAAGVELLGHGGTRQLTGMEFAQALGLRSLRFAFSVLSLDAPAPVRTGRPLVLGGFLRDIGHVELQRALPGRGWRRVRTVHAEPDGRFTETLRAVAGRYRLAVDGIVGPAVTAVVRP